jgi:diaminopimelate epimerase
MMQGGTLPADGGSWRGLPIGFDLASFRRMKFSKYHALGNDYLVIAPGEAPEGMDCRVIRALCHRNFGVGSDGILYGPLRSDKAAFGLRIYNPDGSEAEKSGNGLRIFSRYLWDCGLVGADEFTIETIGGVVRSTVSQAGRSVQVEMGRVSFWSSAIPVTGAEREVLNESVTVGEQVLKFCAATIGNPHCVVPLDEVTEAMARSYGPLLETHPYFPRRTNVQLLQVLDRGRIRIEIWERGAGYTLASGSSSSAAAAVAHRLGLCDRDIAVEMPGGVIRIEIGPDYEIRMTGGVTRVGAGTTDDELFEAKLPEVD